MTQVRIELSGLMPDSHSIQDRGIKMFTGIIQGQASVVVAAYRSEVLSITVRLPSPAHAQNLVEGASVAINGCCLTVTKVNDGVVSFDLVQETLERSTLGSLTAGSVINFERSLKFGDEVGGHILSGHVDTIARIVKVSPYENSRDLTFAVEPRWMRYIFEKGYVGLNGASLTIAKVDRERGELSVSLIPETLKITTFGGMQEGDKVNVEIDRTTQVIVETVERVLKERSPG
jgi:riboflavin synthase